MFRYQGDEPGIKELMREGRRDRMIDKLLGVGFCVFVKHSVHCQHLTDTNKLVCFVIKKWHLKVKLPLNKRKMKEESL